MTPRPALVLDDPYRPGPAQTAASDPAPPTADTPAPRRRAAKAPKAAANPAPADAPSPATRDEQAQDLLAGERRQVNVQVPAELWQAVQDRADELGFPLRVLVADALLAAMELDTDAHAARAMDVNRRARRPRRIS